MTFIIGKMGLTRSSEHRDFIKKVKTFCGSYREMLGADGKLNPVTLVWWQKNYDGLVDKSEVDAYSQQPVRDYHRPKAA